MGLRRSAQSACALRRAPGRLPNCWPSPMSVLTRRRAGEICAVVTCLLLWLAPAQQHVMAASAGAPLDPRIEQLLARMTVAEKIGQLALVNADTSMSHVAEDLHRAIRQGSVGAVLNAVDVRAV